MVIDEHAIFWVDNIIISIKALSNIDEQKVSWSGKHPCKVSSFSETLAPLYDDYDFTDFIELFKKRDTHVYYELLKLDKLVKEFEITGYEMELEEEGYEKILKNSKWIQITSQAKNVYYILLSKIISRAPHHP